MGRQLISIQHHSKRPFFSMKPLMKDNSPMFPSQGGPMGPPPGHLESRTGQPQAGPPTAPPPSFVPAQTQQARAHLQLIQVVLEDVYSDIRMCG